MIRQCFLLLVLLVVSLQDVHADTYVWTDEQGTMNFTDEIGTVPKKFRKNVRKLGEDEPAPVLKGRAAATAAKTTDEALQAIPGAGKGGGESYAGKSYDQWKKDLDEREAAMTALRKRMDEIADQLKNTSMRKGEMDKLVAEHKSLLAQFNEMKNQYNQQVENARKAGLQVTIQQ
jgi:hypothetical protein